MLVKRWGISLKLWGEKNISNAVAVVAFLHANGFEADVIREALRGFRGGPPTAGTVLRRTIQDL